MQVKTLQKYRTKTVPQLLKIAEKHFNRYVRERDSVDGYVKCISCDRVIPTNESHASHYYSAGHNSALRFHEDNVHASCLRCNTFLHGNLIEYRKRLEVRIGTDKLLYLDNTCHNICKWDKVALIEIIETYKGKCRTTS